MALIEIKADFTDVTGKELKVGDTLRTNRARAQVLISRGLAKAVERTEAPIPRYKRDSREKVSSDDQV